LTLVFACAYNGVMNNNKLSLTNLVRFGSRFYVENLKDDLEKNHMGEYVIIDVEEKRYVLDRERLAAILRAREEFGPKLFYIVRVGDVWRINDNPSFNAWFL
jgi:hypothetical protein